MFHRLFQVLLTYVTRPMMWVLGGFYGLLLIGMLADFLSHPTSKTSRPSDAAYPPFPSFGRTLTLNDLREIRDFDAGKFDHSAGTLVIHWPTAFAATARRDPEVASEPRGPAFSAKHLRHLQSCRHLRSLEIQSRNLRDDEWEALAELKQLEALALTGGGLWPKNWRQLGRLPKLRYLDLSGCNLWGDYPDLESLAHVETLILGGFV